MKADPVAIDASPPLKAPSAAYRYTVDKKTNKPVKVYHGAQPQPNSPGRLTKPPPPPMTAQDAAALRARRPKSQYDVADGQRVRAGGANGVGTEMRPMAAAAYPQYAPQGQSTGMYPSGMRPPPSGPPAGMPWNADATTAQSPYWQQQTPYRRTPANNSNTF